MLKYTLLSWRQANAQLSPFVIAQSEGKDPSICQVQEFALSVERIIHIPDTAAETLNTEAAKTEEVNFCRQKRSFHVSLQRKTGATQLVSFSQLCCICHFSSWWSQISFTTSQVHSAPAACHLQPCHPAYPSVRPSLPCCRPRHWQQSPRQSFP